MIHRQNNIKFTIDCLGKDDVGRDGALRFNTQLLGGLDGGYNLFEFFVAEKTTLPGVGIEGSDTNTGMCHSPVCEALLRQL